MSSIRVCAITYDYYPFDTLLRRTAEAAISAGYDYHVICSMEEEPRDGGRKKYEVFNGVHVHYVRMRSIIGKS